MKFQLKTSTPETAPTLADQVRQAIDNAPSRPDLLAARRKMAELSAQHTMTTAEVNQLAQDCAVDKGSALSRAKDLLVGKSVSYDTLAENLATARRRLDVINHAMTIQQRAIREIHVRWSEELQRGLRAVRESLVERMAAALNELRAAAASDAEIQQIAVVAGADHSVIGSIAFLPVCSGVAFDAGAEWLKARRAEGFEV